MKYAVIITTSLVIVAAIVVAIAVPLSKRDDKSPSELAEQWMSETPLIDGYVIFLLMKTVRVAKVFLSGRIHLVGIIRMTYLSQLIYVIQVA